MSAPSPHSLTSPARRRAQGACALVLAALLTAVAFAQFQSDPGLPGGGRGGFGNGGFGRRGGMRGGFGNDGGGAANIDAPVPPELLWPLNPAFREDVFAFARLIYTSEAGYTTDGHWRTGGIWRTDTPLVGGEGDADANLAFRLHQITSLKVRPGHTYITITPENLARYPFVYAVEPGRMVLRPAEVAALRHYLLTGGFFMLDDNWGDGEWANIRDQMKRIFPERDPVELQIDHPIFHTVFDLKQKPQMPAIGMYFRTGMTWENNKPYVRETHDSHFFGLFDDKGRMMVFISHNNDLGDGWEREGDNIDYFRRFSEPQAYPMFINALFYTMTH